MVHKSRAGALRFPFPMAFLIARRDFHSLLRGFLVK